MLSLILSLLFSSQSAQAKELFEYGQSIRALGMGNAYTAVVDNYESMWYNPAGLGRVEGIHLTVLDLNLGLNGENAYQTVQDYQNSTGTAAEKFSSVFGDQLWFGLGGKVALTTPNFGIGLYDSGYFQLEFKNPQVPRLEATVANDYGLVAGGAVKLGDDVILGMVGKKINRAGGTGEFGVSTWQSGDMAAVTEELDRRGSAFGLDMGMLWRPKGAVLNPTFSFVWKDMGYTTFLPEDGANRPQRIDSEQILGASLGFDVGALDMTAAVDMKHLDNYDEPMGKKLHMGLEIGLPIVDIRGGFSQGYYTLGASLDLFLMRLDLAYYGVELGEYPGQDEDRRLQLQLLMEFSFDPSFNIIDIGKSAKGRKLKQRR